MTNITLHMSTILHQPLWEIMSFGYNCFVYSDMMDHRRDKYVEPMEDFIYRLPQGASDLDILNTFI